MPPAESWRQWFPALTLRDLAICLGLILSIFVVYAQVSGFPFVNYDDDLYVFGNPHVRAGLAPGSIAWAFSGVVSNNWMPVTLLSHMLDVQLFGLRSGMHHLVSVWLHALSAVLLFVLLQHATRARAASAFVAFVFAVHPLHVESVAWVAERKDVLSTFFWFLALYAYLRYTEKPGVGRYLLVVVPFCLGLMSKPMLVTLPFTLLLFDIWPLRRIEWGRAPSPRILWEKLPLFALAIGASVTTYLVQQTSGAFVERFPFSLRIAKALTSYVTYIGQMFWPAGLAVFYPYPQSIPTWEAVAALVVILGMSALAFWAWRMRPYITMGWFWYLGTLVPVIGLVQVGTQSHADRYTYIPLIGLSVMLAWGAADIIDKWPQTKRLLAAAGAISCVLCLALTAIQVAYWKNAEALFQHTIESTGDNWLAESNLGVYLMDSGRGAEAKAHLEAALRIKPDSTDANNDLGAYLAQTGQCEAAVPHFEAALLAKPDLAEASNNLGWCLTHIGRYAEAIPRLESALHFQPDFLEAHFNLAGAFAKVPGRDRDAVAQYEAALRLKPDYADAHRNLGMVLVRLGRGPDAISHFETAQLIHPDPEIKTILDQVRAAQKSSQGSPPGTSKTPSSDR